MSNYLLIDFGNSYIKAAIYDSSKKGLVESHQCKKTTNSNDLLSQFKFLKKNKKVSIIEAATTCSGYICPFNKGLKKALKTDVKIVSRTDFAGLLDLSNIKSNVVIGTDILISAFYCCKKFKTRSAFFSLGTAYYAIIVDKKQIANCYLLPSLSKGMNTISTLTAIPRDYLPKTYFDDIGNDTPSSFAAGLNTMMEGFVDLVLSKNKVNKKNVVLTGGDVFKFKNINKKYKETKNAILLGLAELAKEKKW